MLPLERRNQILEILSKKQATTVDELCAALYSSGATIRRDLQILESSGLIRRTHGGAVHIDNNTRDFPLTLRENENSAAKEQLAQKALALVKDGQTLFMDSSSTVCHLARRLSGFQSVQLLFGGRDGLLEQTLLLGDQIGVGRVQFEELVHIL